METDVEKTENTVEQPVEENVEGIELTDTAPEEKEEEVKKYTDEDLDEILSKKIARERRKIEREYDNKYKDYIDIGNIVSQGLEADNISDAKTKVKDFYQEQGIEFKESRYSDKEAKVLGRDDAEEILDLGLDVAEEEADKLASIGYDKLSTRDKQKFNILAEELTRNKNIEELKSMGVDGKILEDKDFKEFESQFNSKTPIKKIYEMYKLTQPKKEVHIIGSMKGEETKPVKDYYTDAEISKLTPTELANDEVWEKVRKSMIRKGE